ncbi:hypothetical protein HID58_002092, partial [Brassica napus]
KASAAFLLHKQLAFASLRMKLDVNVLRYLSKDDFRVLTAVEMGMRNHEIVPSELVDRIAGLKHGGTYKVLKNLLKYKLLHHDRSKYDGFRLTYLGYDFLAIKTLVNRGVFTGVGRQIGVGKESDIFEVAQEDGTILAMKLHRLGRTSFRAVKSKRDYLRHRSSFSWLYLSRLAALKEFAFMKALQEHDFPVPKAIDCNRHCVIMSLVQGYPMVQVKQLQNPETVFEKIIGIVVRLAEHGLIHCDFNEFNIMIDDEEKLTMIDFPQMVSVSHQNAQMYFDRDIECIFKFFRKRFNMTFQEERDEADETEVEVDENSRPSFYDITKDENALDRELEASGFTKKEQNDLDKFIEGGLEKSEDSDEDEESDDEEQTAESNEEENLNEMKSLQLQEEEQKSSDGVEAEAELDDNEKGESSGDEDEAGRDEELDKKLGKQRRRAMAAARGGRKSQSSRNTYKDKGGRSQNSKIHTNMSGWGKSESNMQRYNFVEAEEAYRRALSIAPDNNKMCNIGICLMKQGRIDEAKETLRRVKPAVVDGPRGVDSHLKAYERAQQMLSDIGSETMRRGGGDRVEQRRLFDAMFEFSSVWQPQPCREESAKLDLNNDGYNDENVKTTNVNVVNNPLRVDAKPFVSSKMISKNEKLKRTRSSSQTTMGMLSCSGDNKEFEEAMIMAVLGIETKVVDKKRLKVFQDITLSCLSPRA